MSLPEDTKAVLLFDGEEPYARLNPSYDYPIVVNVEKTSNIISYCYSGLVKPGGVRNYILKTKAREGKTLAFENYDNDLLENYKTAVGAALEEKYKNKDFREDLKNTSGRALVYPDALFAELLTQFREKIIREDTEAKEKEAKEMEQKKINDIYFAYGALEKIISSGENNLRAFDGKPPSKIIEMLKIRNSKFEIPKKHLSNEMMVLFENPSLLTSILRKKYAKIYNENALNKNKNVILFEYLESKAKENYPDAKISKKIVFKFLNDLPQSETNELKDRVYDLWVNGMIIVDAQHLKILFTKEEVENFKRMNIPSVSHLSEKKEKGFILPPLPMGGIGKDEEEIKGGIREKNDRIHRHLLSLIEGATSDSPPRSPRTHRQVSVNEYLITDTDPNSPLFPHFIEISNLLYPTIMHYTYAQAFSTFWTVVKSGIEAHDNIMINPYESSRYFESYKTMDELSGTFHDLQRRNKYNILTERARASLKAKFSPGEKVMPGLLVATFPRRLLYNDYTDDILGTGKITNKSFSGANEIGEIMMEIRQSLMERGVKPIIIEDLTPTDLTLLKIVGGNQAETKWLNKKTKELIYILRAFSDYKQDAINGDDVEFVLEKILHSCSKLYKMFSETSMMPKDFAESIKEIPERRAQVEIWKYVYFLKLALEKVNGFDFKKFDKSVEKFEKEFNSSQDVEEGFPKFKQTLDAFESILLALKERGGRDFVLGNKELLFAYRVISIEKEEYGKNPRVASNRDMSQRELQSISKVLERFRQQENLEPIMNYFIKKIMSEESGSSRTGIFIGHEKK